MTFWAFLLLCQSSFLYFGGVFNKTIIPLELVGYEMIIANSALRAWLAIYHLISNARSRISIQCKAESKNIEHRVSKRMMRMRFSQITVCEPAIRHSRPQSLRFFLSHGRRVALGTRMAIRQFGSQK